MPGFHRSEETKARISETVLGFRRRSNEEIAEFVAAGNSYAEASRWCGMSQQRVRQLILGTERSADPDLLKYKRWTPEQVEDLVRRRDAGKSAGQISQVMPFSRNAILGKLHRIQQKASRTPSQIPQEISQNTSGKALPSAPGP